ncbi:hypothetical protein K458DRAFT_488757 [Lentithecium fluviatile CBS 122367]|uniref:Uncharacterized protein n=1 Tax=Lentithecium fluviatile CBS 122367 TaxID=1168545 RepID=A0A6G1IX55_9PLEO|nr:hypothetical protein K458DRAFT_488757 [Lentithecium fluviatile CBS 122367]
MREDDRRRVPALLNSRMTWLTAWRTRNQGHVGTVETDKLLLPLAKKEGKKERKKGTCLSAIGYRCPLHGSTTGPKGKSGGATDVPRAICGRNARTLACILTGRIEGRMDPLQYSQGSLAIGKRRGPWPEYLTGGSQDPAIEAPTTSDSHLTVRRSKHIAATGWHDEADRARTHWMPMRNLPVNVVDISRPGKPPTKFFPACFSLPVQRKSHVSSGCGRRSQRVSCESSRIHSAAQGWAKHIMVSSPPLKNPMATTPRSCIRAYIIYPIYHLPVEFRTVQRKRLAGSKQSMQRTRQSVTDRPALAASTCSASLTRAWVAKIELKDEPRKAIITSRAYV